jgi:hypothetical protein
MALAIGIMHACPRGSGVEADLGAIHGHIAPLARYAAQSLAITSLLYGLLVAFRGST